MLRSCRKGEAKWLPDLRMHNSVEQKKFPFAERAMLPQKERVLFLLTIRWHFTVALH